MRFDLDRNLPRVGQIWQHYKGGRYEIVGIGLFDSNGEAMVIYKASPATDGRWFVRTGGDFLSTAPHHQPATGYGICKGGFRFTLLIADREDDGRKA